MRIGIEVKREITSPDLRRQARQEKTGRVVTRLLAIANVLDEVKWEDAAKQTGMSRSRLTDWIKRY